MNLTDERIIRFLEKRLNEKGIDREKFLNPSLNDLRDANLIKGMSEAVSKIKSAICDKKKILIFGDYDSDGICSSTMLYLYLRSVGANVNVFIPNRFQDGYGISIEAIEEIEFDYSPDLIITVDLGITAVEEVEILKQENIDIVITDHHIPLSEIPDAVVVDPKIDPGKTYGFDALCGAGVVLKLIEALSGRDEALKYLDICAIATVGDIVPLVDENRVIAKFGIEKINRGECLESLKFLMKKLDLSEITSSDISFKIVPRLNACGRVDSAIKVFDFLIETDLKQLEIKYAEIEGDNTLRLSAIDQGNRLIEKALDEYDSSEPSVLIQGDFHEGVIGILASHVANEIGKPAIIFTKDEDGNLKGSGRSVAGIDIHKIISSLSGFLENFGGHKMACGLEISPDNFDEFKAKFNKAISMELSGIREVKAGYDIEISDDDFNLKFLNELELLEPFGCENEKPVIAMKVASLRAEPVSEKAFKHFRLYTEKNNIIMAFNAYKNVELLRSNAQKFIIIDMAKNTFNGKVSLNCTLKKIDLISSKFDENEERNLMVSLYKKFYSIFDFNDTKRYFEKENIFEIVSQKFSEERFGTIVAASKFSDLEKLEKMGIDTQNYLSSEPLKSGANAIISAGGERYKIGDFKGYKNIIFLERRFESENLFLSQRFDVYENKTIFAPKKFALPREKFVRVYKLVCEFQSLYACDELDFAEKLAFRATELKKSEILICLLVFIELNFIEFDDKLNKMKVLKAKKMELSSSKFYREVCDEK